VQQLATQAAVVVLGTKTQLPAKDWQLMVVEMEESLLMVPRQAPAALLIQEEAVVVDKAAAPLAVMVALE
jgi:hypothetical protein